MNEISYSHIPEDQAQQLIKHAATISGNPAAEMAIQEAVKILEERGVKMPTYNPAIDKAAAMLWATMDTRQLKRILSANDAELENAFSSVIEELAQKAQEAIPAQDAQEVKIFDAKVWEDAAGNYAEIRRCLNDRTLAAMEPAKEILTDTVAHISKAAREALATITEIANSPAYKAIKEKLQETGRIIEEYRLNLNYKELATASEELKQLIPFLQMEIDAAQDDPAFSGCTLEEVLDKGFSAGLQPIDSKYRPLIDRAMQQLEEHRRIAETVAEIEQAAEELPRIIANPTDKINYPLDKPNSIIWDLIADAAGTANDGQVKMKIDTSRSGSKQDALIYYSIDFDALGGDVTISRQLTPFDKRCYIAAAALFNADNKIISARQIYFMMGNTTEPNDEDLRKVNDSLTKMGAARVYIDNQEEVNAQKGATHFKYDAALLPFERMSAYINGKLTESAIHLFREPPMISFAKQRNQVTTIPRQLLESPISKTDANLRIDDYLLERISHMQSPKSKAPRKMLYSTIFSNCAIKTAKQKQRAKSKIRRYLDYYKQCKWIKGYIEETDGITII